MLGYADQNIPLEGKKIQKFRKQILIGRKSQVQNIIDYLVSHNFFTLFEIYFKSNLIS